MVHVDDNCVGPLYKHVFLPQHAPRLAFIGLNSRMSFTPIFPMYLVLFYVVLLFLQLYMIVIRSWHSLSISWVASEMGCPFLVHKDIAALKRWDVGWCLQTLSRNGSKWNPEASYSFITFSGFCLRLFFLPHYW